MTAATLASGTIPTRRPLPLNALLGVFLATLVSIWAASQFAAQADRQTASSLARGEATLIADALGLALARGETLSQAAAGVAAGASQADVTGVRVIDTYTRTVSVLDPNTGTVQTEALTQEQKPLFDAALAVRSRTQGDRFAAATGFVGADGSGVGMQAARSADAEGAMRPSGMVEVTVAPRPVSSSAWPRLQPWLMAGLAGLACLLLVLTGGSPFARWTGTGAVAAAAASAALHGYMGIQSGLNRAGDDLAGLGKSLFGLVAPSQGTSLTLSQPGDPQGFAISVGLAGLIATLLCWVFSTGAMNRLWETIKTHRTAYLYIAPAIIMLILLSFFPFFYGIAVSFTDTSLLNQSQPFLERLNGIDNYTAILGDFNFRQPETGVLNYQNFYWTALMTLIWTVTNVVIGVSIGLGLALLLNIKGLKGVAIYRTLLILPWALPNYITALAWKGLFHPQFGAFNELIQAFGGEPVKWFDTLWPAFFTGLATNAWLSFPFMMVVSLGALQSIQQDMYEAAKIDGASPWQRFTMITLPSLKPALLPAIIVSVVWTFNMFNVIFLVSAGQPSGGTEILVTRAYKIAFEEYRYGYAAAYSVVIFAILLVYGVFQVRATKATEANA